MIYRLNARFRIYIVMNLFVLEHLLNMLWKSAVLYKRAFHVEHVIYAVGKHFRGFQNNF
ncbi:MAG: hypothetical protein J5726_03920 [Treponema sp.]|nr:hypothetical protein [Treponema sp.]